MKSWLNLHHFIQEIGYLEEIFKTYKRLKYLFGKLFPEKIQKYSTLCNFQYTFSNSLSF